MVTPFAQIFFSESNNQRRKNEKADNIRKDEKANFGPNCWFVMSLLTAKAPSYVE